MRPQPREQHAGWDGRTWPGVVRGGVKVPHPRMEGEGWWEMRVWGSLERRILFEKGRVVTTGTHIELPRFPKFLLGVSLMGWVGIGPRKRWWGGQSDGPA
eukprot:768599-Hanusia_phi.AAC.6